MISKKQIENILKDKDPQHLETLALKSSQLTQQYFGRTISLYAPLYLSNYCSSYCTYCGFNLKNKIERMKLTEEQMHQEMKRIAEDRIENILLLTGESYQATPFSYLKKAVATAKQYFSSISLEIYPMETEEYRELFLCGVDGVTIYQETYNQERYHQVHLSGKKKDYAYRKETPARIARSGIRQISLGILLGLYEDISEDLLSLYQHVRWMEKNFPGIEYSFSFPRLRKIKGQSFEIADVDDITFIKIICLTRILFPRIGINLSTRENIRIRDHALLLGVTRMSAGSKTSVGGYAIKSIEHQEPQFDIEDTRSVNEIVDLLKKKNVDPIFTDWRNIQNEGIASPFI